MGIDLMVDSAGTGDWHVGQLPDLRSRRVGEACGCDMRMRARTVSPQDFEKFDLIVAMDRQNVRDLEAILGARPEKIRLARSFDPDLMLIDFSMPHLDGCAVAKQLRGTEQFGATPLVVVSGHTDPEHRALCIAAGFDKYLVKPVPLEILMRLVDEVRRAKAIAAERRVRSSDDVQYDNAAAEVASE